MKKFIGIILLLLVTGGITYALKTGAFKDSGEGGKEVGSAKVDSSEGNGASSESGRRRGSGGRRVSVEVAEVKVGGVQETLGYVGSLHPQTSVEVFSKVEGRLEEIFVDVGSWIKEGSLIARIEQEEIIEEVRETEASVRVAQATLKGKEAEMKNLERQLERSKLLFKKNFISRQELDTVETQHYSAIAQTDLAKAQVAQKEAVLQNARIHLRNTEIRSPITGYVGKKLLDRGAMIKTSTPIVSLVAIDPVTTLISVVERDYRKMKPGLAASIQVDAYPGRTFSGKIARISPVLDKDTRTADIEIEIPNSGKELKPGMFAKVEIVAQKRPRGVPGQVKRGPRSIQASGEGFRFGKLAKSDCGTRSGHDWFNQQGMGGSARFARVRQPGCHFRG
jgi:RND family efflux transporter MFP subunit